MRNQREFAEWSYRSHESDSVSKTPEFVDTWYREDTVDAWRHARMYGLLDPLLAAHPGATWVTVGDGRLGCDAHYIASKGGRALATNIADDLLRKAHAAGYIEAFSKQNAEALTFPEQSFDFAFCKESYHHFPRPMIALYEMIRVARKGVVLIEPFDRYLGGGWWNDLYTEVINALIRFFFRFNVHRHNYEKAGNYVYSISEREVEKVALGINLPAVAFKGINDYYQDGVEFEVANSGSKLFRRVRRVITLYDILAKFGLIKYRYVCTMIFKTPLSDDLRKRLVAGGYRVMDLPSNPYCHSDPPSKQDAVIKQG